MAFTALSGTVSIIWSAMRAALVYLDTNMSALNVTATTVSVSAGAQSMRNARECIAVSDFSVAMAQAFSDLDPITTISIQNITPSVIAIISARVTAIQLAAQQSALLPILTYATTVLSSGQPVIGDPGFIEWLYNFTGEGYPAGFTSETSGSSTVLATYALQVAQAWATLLSLIPVQSLSYTGSTYNAVARMAQAALEVSNDIQKMFIMPSTNLPALWNSMVTIPTLLKYAATANDPTTLAGQQKAVVRYLAGVLFDQLNVVLSNLRVTVPSNVRLAKVRVGDTLMDIAARETGDVEQWSTIAQLNNLSYPYISATRQTGCAVPGQQLYLPTSTVPTTISAIPDYSVNYLGVDLYYGPLRQPMLAWTGDFNTISGYSNLSMSCGRAIMTTLGTLIYHTTFGSRVPPEVGAVATSGVAGYIGAYAVAAVMADPRVYNVSNVVITVVNSVYAVNVEMDIIPNGFGAQTVTLNEVLQPVQ